MVAGVAWLPRVLGGVALRASQTPPRCGHCDLLFTGAETEARGGGWAYLSEVSWLHDGDGDGDGAGGGLESRGPNYCLRVARLESRRERTAREAGGRGGRGGSERARVAPCLSEG